VSEHLGRVWRVLVGEEIAQQRRDISHRQPAQERERAGRPGQARRARAASRKPILSGTAGGDTERL
jgi:hypothetical protein